MFYCLILCFFFVLLNFGSKPFYKQAYEFNLNCLLEINFLKECICDEIKMDEVSKQKFLRIDDADRNFLENFVTYLGLGSENDFTALILLQQSIILSQTLDLSSISNYYVS